MFADFGFSDAVDVIVTAAIFYIAFTWLRRSQVGLVAFGLAIVAGVYLGARALGLALTIGVLHGFFAVLALALVVIFQEELRQGFEEIAAWALGRRDENRPRLDATEVLVTALGELAQQKVGALVVLPGVQRIDRHVRGGVPLGGDVSAPLLKSLFDPHSDGHDGAVVIEDRSVVSFGGHLPLAKAGPAKVASCRSRTGTRHSAALGLSERTDALCIVVSEERGTISVASQGRLRETSSPRELAKTIADFLRHRRALVARTPSAPGGWGRAAFVRDLFRTNRREKATALAVSLCAWVALVGASRPGERVFHVPVEISGADVAPIPAEVDVTLVGPRRELFAVSQGDLRIHVPYGAVRDGRLTLRAGDLAWPDGLELRGFEPADLEITRPD